MGLSGLLAVRFSEYGEITTSSKLWYSMSQRGSITFVLY